MESKNFSKKSVSRLIGFFSDNKGRYLKGIAFLLVINLLQLWVPRITGDVIDAIQEGNIDSQGLINYSVLILAIALMIFILNYLSRVQIVGAANLFDFSIRNSMFKHLENLSMKFFNKKGVGDLMALSTNDVSSIRMAMGRGVILVIDTLFLMVASIVILTRTIDLRLTLMAFAPFPILIYIMARFGKIINKRFRRVQESFADLTRKAQENISGIRVIKAFVQEDKEIDNFKRINKDNYKINMDMVRIWGVFFPLIGFVSSISFLIVLTYGGNLVIDGQITLGDFIAFNSYIGIILRPIAFIGMMINFIQRGKASLDRVEELFHQKPDVSDSDQVKSKETNYRLEGMIEFKNLTFSYEEGQKPVLQDINLTIEPGKTLGIIGRVGSGKTTLINLILRLYNPQKPGQLTIDGVDIMDIPLVTLRDNIGYVPQDNYLFSATIKENIGFSPREFSREEVEKAAKVSQVYDNIIQFPKGFDTMLGERGVNLSGGQKQRVSIARALIKDPSILILDDSLSAVDTKTEESILEGLGLVMKDRTSIMIAHRISTLKDADEIVVLEKGRIIEKGNHQQLVDMKGVYYKMYQRQLLEDKIVNS